ncbi:ASCH domain-containing protein [Methylobacterium sp. V23]|uniref:ASCH domain-containing protein n=1 Tax=Methylobacterium sp. V23 TaxID=2044878 RepID=UPI000CDA8038|nr:ASCH domain-containing protein [Methylobacterium sp. V23]POR41304.1 hypothetical protein CRT23_19300 [Methylobacterium sp. V23]
MRGLLVRQPWAELILRGTKVWELRSHGTSLNGPIAIIPQGTGQIAGIVDLVAVHPRLSPEELAASTQQHCVPLEQQAEVIAAGWLIPWEFARPHRLPYPVPYRHPLGAVIWVRLEPEVTAAIRTQIAVNSLPSVQPRPIARAIPLITAAPDARTAEVPLTEGNLRNGHIYLRSARHLFRDVHIGGSSKSAPALQPITVELGAHDAITTDIAGDKMILRERRAVRAFLRDAQAGDHVRIERLDIDRFRFTLMP